MRSISRDEDITILQNDINNLHAWSIDWGLKINPTNCVVLCTKRSHTIDHLKPQSYTVDNAQLNLVTDVHDLGVTVDNKLTWSEHIYAIVRKAHSRSWLCMRALGFHAYQKAQKTFYITMVWSILDIWFCL